MPHRSGARLRRALLAILPAGLALVLAACGGGGTPPGPQLVIPDTTKVLDADGLKALTSADAAGTLTFSASTPQLAALAKGDVLIVPKGSLTPVGLLRMVDGVSASGGQVTVTTHQATLTDAVETGRFELHRTLDPSQATAAPVLAQGVRMLPQAGGQGFAIGLNGVWLDDSGKVTASGTVSAQPSLDLVIDIEHFTLKQASFTVGGAEAATLALDATYANSLTRETTLYSQVFPPIPLAPQLALYLIPSLDLVVGANGSVSAAVSTSIGESADVSLGAGYANGSVAPIAKATATYQHDPPTFQGEASASVYAGPRINVALDGLDFAYLDTRGHADTHAQAASGGCTDWTLGAGVRADVGLTFKVLAITLLDYHKTLLDVTKTLDKGSQCGAPAPSGWSRSYGGSSADGAFSVDRTADGGSIVVANSYSFTPGRAWVLKLAADGALQWQELLDGAGVLTDVQSWGTGYVLAGNDAPSHRATVVRLDGAGKVVWAHGYGSSDGLELVAASVRPTSDGGLVLGGSYGTFTDPPDNGDMWAAKLDAHGAVSWSRHYGGAAWDYAEAVRPVAGGYVLAGTTDNSFDSHTGSDVWLVRLDSGGTPVWQRRLGGADGNDYGHDVQATADGGLMVAASSSSFSSSPARGDGWLVKLDAGGAVSWGEDYDAGTDYDRLYAVRQTGDGGYLAAGTSGLGVSQSNLWTLRLDPAGGVSWSKTYGGSSPDEVGNGIREGIGDPLVALPDGGALVAGTASSFGASADAWLLRLPPSGALSFAAGTGGTVTSTSGAFTATPNVTAPTTSGSVADVTTTVTDLTSTVQVTATSGSATTLAP